MTDNNEIFIVLEEQEAIAGEDLRKGEIVTVWKEGEGEAYAYRYSSEKKQMEAEGVSDRDAKKGEAVKVYKAEPTPKVHPFYGIHTDGLYKP